MASLRMYKRAIVLLLVTATCSFIILMHTETSSSKMIIINDPNLKNTSVNKSAMPVRIVKSFELFNLPDDVVKNFAPVGVFYPKAAVTKERVLYDATTVSSILKLQNMSKADFLKRKTLYPVTLYAPYLMENPKLCASVPDLSILVIVHTAPAHLERRSVIRQTWTNETYFRHLGRLRVLFLLGKVLDSKLQQDLEQEFKTYGDLLQGDFIDAYRNLSHKGVMAYKWISERCKNAKIILKVDDDIVVNTYEMLTKYVPMYSNKTKQIFCNHIFPGTMPIIRENNSKWYVEENLFKGQKFYPRYCSGFMVVFTNDFMSALHRAAAVTPFFWVDDVYLYGMVPGKVSGVKYNSFPPNSVQLTGTFALKCYKNATRTCNYLVTGGRSKAEKQEVWEFMRKQYEAKSMVTDKKVILNPSGKISQEKVINAQIP